MHSSTSSTSMAIYRFAILTSSDRCSAGLANDESGPFLKNAIESANEGYSVTELKVVPDQKKVIELVLREWCERRDIDCILTTGGTGFTPCDVTPEATKSVLEKDAPGLVHALLAASLKVTPMAMLSRLTAGIRKDTLIVNFPGSKKACRECFAVLSPVLKHALEQLKNDRQQIERVHSTMEATRSKVVLLPVADRNRQSPYEMVPMETAFAAIVQQIECYFTESEPSQYRVIVLARDVYQHNGSILAQDVFASVPLPPFNASIKDGYAVIAQDGDGLRKVLPKVSLAGSHSAPTLSPGFCVRISTGAAVPDGATAVVQVEDTQLMEKTPDNEEAVIRITSVPKVGQDIRPRGSDIALDRENPLLARHTCLSPIELGLLASAGVPSVELLKKPTVAVMSTGDEVVSPGEPLPANCIWDSNRAVLLSLLAPHYNVIDLGIIPDNLDDTFRGIKRALDLADCLITTGGVSMGERDLLKHVLKEDFAADIHFGRVNLKPGKPTTFATCWHNGHKKFIFALPGNPVSCFVTFQVFVRPTLELLAGKYFALTEETRAQGLLAVHRTVKCRLVLAKPFKLDPRPEFARAIVSFPAINQPQNEVTALECFPTVRLTESNQISSRLLNVKDANALVLLKSRSDIEGQQFARDGTFVDAILL